MKEQLLKLIKDKNLTSAKFADVIGVQASSISHILSDRNKPSYDFILKILSRFPELNAEWLLSGKGSMYKTKEQPTLFNENNIPQNSNNEIIQIEEKIPLNIHEKIDDKSEILQSKGLKEEPKSSSSKIEKIVLFYSDKTFNEYIPK